MRRQTKLWHIVFVLGQSEVFDAAVEYSELVSLCSPSPGASSLRSLRRTAFAKRVIAPVLNRSTHPSSLSYPYSRNQHPWHNNPGDGDSLNRRSLSYTSGIFYFEYPNDCSHIGGSFVWVGRL